MIDGGILGHAGGRVHRWSSFEPLHVIMHSRDGRVIDRVPHDYQRIVPDFRGDQVALPSDQGLHIVNGTSTNLTSAVGDLRNTMALSAIISPSATKPGSRSLVVNLWDWDVGASWDDGATWAGWNKNETSPGWCGEGGGGQGMGTSGKTIMFHHSSWGFSEDGGQNWIRGNLPGGAGAFAYLRKYASRAEPEGTCFALLSAPANGYASDGGARARTGDSDSGGDDTGRNYRPEMGDDDDDDDEKRWTSIDPLHVHAGADEAGGRQPRLPDGVARLWQDVELDADARRPAGGRGCRTHNEYALCAHRRLLARSTKGTSWSACINGTGLTGSFSQLLVKDSEVMFMLRNGAVPLRTKDGGKTWHELRSAAPLFKYGATLGGSLSWSGRTLVLHGADLSAIGRNEYSTVVWKSSNDGKDWVDETGDLVTISPGPGVWYERDFYFVTRGEGVTVKRNFEEWPAAAREVDDGHVGAREDAKRA